MRSGGAAAMAGRGYYPAPLGLEAGAESLGAGGVHADLELEGELRLARGVARDRAQDRGVGGGNAPVLGSDAKS